MESERRISSGVNSWILSVLMLITGCVSDRVAEPDDLTKFCVEEKQLGSHIKKVRCRTQAEIERENRAARRVLQETISPTGQNTER
ncbi:MAG: hypothetical protein JJ934_13800 [Pseudomonadales bacterium]|nr:hypothetical protein [Pseudomonadales bacterium]MBO6703510.1 hypothetical protein [Pseudomonadales bacterium]MBO7004616.1 hypothetical protein [Pseudomonadales bacterium]